MPKCTRCEKEFVDVLEEVGRPSSAKLCPECLDLFLIEPAVYVPRSGPGDEMSTCFKCPDNTTCKFAWDEYNLDGDCLMSK
jgi:hypothetical protein